MAKRKTAATAEPEPPPPRRATPSSPGAIGRSSSPTSSARSPSPRRLVNALESNRVAHAYLFTGARGVGKTSHRPHPRQGPQLRERADRHAVRRVRHLPAPSPPARTSTCSRSTAPATAASTRSASSARTSSTGPAGRATRSTSSTKSTCSRRRRSTPCSRRSKSRRRTSSSSSPPPKCRRSRSRSCRAASASTSPASARRGSSSASARSSPSEKMQADDEALELVARRAGGSMRDAQSLLDQLLAFGGERLTAEQVHHLLGTAGDDRVADAGRGRPRARRRSGRWTCSTAAADEGLQLGELLDQLIDYWRDLMVVHCAGAEAPRPERRPVPSGRRWPGQCGGAGARRGPGRAGRTGCHTARLTGANHARHLVEMALVRLTRLGTWPRFRNSARPVAKGRVEGVPAPRAATPPAERSRRRPAGGGKKKAATAAGRAGRVAVGRAVRRCHLRSMAFRADCGRRMFAAQLEKAGLPAILGPNTLVWTIPSRYNQDASTASDRPASAPSNRHSRN